MRPTFLNPTEEAGRKLFTGDMSKPVVMLNLLKFRPQADFTQYPELTPPEPISGKEAYELYIKCSQPFLEAAGGRILFMGRSQEYFIGPSEETWDFVMLIAQRSLKDFLNFASDKDYLVGIGYRAAALSDSRLLPISETHGI